MIWYHYTSTERLVMIRSTGIIRTTESNIGSGRSDWPPFGSHVGPDVVWLTDEPEPDSQALALTTIDGSDKTEVRITVSLADDEVMWWPDFAKQHGIHRQWRRALELGRDPQSWWVVERAIALCEVVAIEQRFSDSVTNP